VFDHLYGKTRFRKTRLISVLISKENQAMVFWVLAMQDVGLSISVQPLKRKWQNSPKQGQQLSKEKY